jgi:hypothetical protein
MDEFKTHLSTHKYNQNLAEEQYQIYNVKMIQDMVKDSQDNFPAAVQLATDLVKERALELGRVDWLEDPLGRSSDLQARRERRAGASPQ